MTDVKLAEEAMENIMLPVMLSTLLSQLFLINQLCFNAANM